ncbi:(2Fe-2S) ferredoxin domain-containing protein [Nocardiopsis sp. RSe5-2]|uniref:(2Fe-2S) ferredoxin domain-containing protein n=1 Tax=Nocardiopsis endophytica TaxID=3018445 RepID=A0ABT4U110_9ACTN|nr:(2Fe-2S) ferredoxin domain-containing protein [Nocardiopsis endophytica]MDA2810616.1 (2Fe-2S) ferredoxin domain-containing protein [Nocardiopsis endophytica]
MDHKAQLQRLSGLEDHEGRSVPVRVSKCLGICFKANVVVVQPSSKGRAGGGRPVWLGDFAEDRLVDELDDWIFQGGPGVAPVPEPLRPHLTSKDAKKPKKKKLKKQLKRKRKRAEEEKRAASKGAKDKKGKKDGPEKAKGEKKKKKKKKK